MARDIIFLDEINRGRNNGKPLPVVLFADIDAECNSSALVKSLLGTGASSVVFGDSGSGKTFAAIDLAFHIAAGRAWFGFRTSRGCVLYVAGEGSLGVRNRLAAIKKHYQATDLPLGIVTTAVDLRSEQADTDRLIDAAAHLGDEFGSRVVLVVIDTLSRALAGGNESASEDMGALVMNIDKLRQATGAHVLLIHHSGKDQAKGALGHSLLRAAVDTEIEVTRDADSAVSTL